MNGRFGCSEMWTRDSADISYRVQNDFLPVTPNNLELLSQQIGIILTFIPCQITATRSK